MLDIGCRPPAREKTDDWVPTFVDALPSPRHWDGIEGRKHRLTRAHTDATHTCASEPVLVQPVGSVVGNAMGRCRFYRSFLRQLVNHTSVQPAVPQRDLSMFEGIFEFVRREPWHVLLAKRRRKEKRKEKTRRAMNVLILGGSALPLWIGWPPSLQAVSQPPSQTSWPSPLPHSDERPFPVVGWELTLPQLPRHLSPCAKPTMYVCRYS
ncbi:hypothetical protein LX36DRAFT_424977 [Colletotrichum falcatum]|nr:hypothetical protein LX36DRAFT_424977 [Colletotrichum falcatum]